MKLGRLNSQDQSMKGHISLYKDFELYSHVFEEAIGKSWTID